jgi:hypothetical protein
VVEVAAHLHLCHEVLCNERATLLELLPRQVAGIGGLRGQHDLLHRHVVSAPLRTIDGAEPAPTQRRGPPASGTQLRHVAVGGDL